MKKFIFGFRLGIGITLIAIGLLVLLGWWANATYPWNLRGIAEIILGWFMIRTAMETHDRNPD